MGAEPSKDPRAYCVPVEPPANENESAVYVSSVRIRENGGMPIAHFRSLPEANTTQDLLNARAAKFGDDPCVGEREPFEDGTFGNYVWMTGKEFRNQVLSFAAALQDLGIKKGDKIGVYGTTSIWWSTTEYASHYLGAVVVPVYDSLGPNAAEYIVHHAECKILVCHISTLANALKIRAAVPELAHIVAFSQVPFDLDPSQNVISAFDLLTRGHDLVSSFTPAKINGEDLAMIMYTSGSTGRPKGCVVTHSNLIAGGTGLSQPAASITSTDTYYAFLPLAHIYEACAEICFMAQGVKIGYFTSIRNITGDLGMLQPTIMLGVPRVFNKFVETMQKKIETMPFFLQKLIKLSMNLKLNALQNDQPPSILLDALIFAKFRAALGGKIRLLVSGGAPMLPEIYNFIRVALTPNIIQGYGLTECSAAGCIQEVGSKDPSGVGPISYATDLKFRRVEGMEYNPQGEFPSGEILLRGPGICGGYYLEPELTEGAFECLEKLDGASKSNGASKLSENSKLSVELNRSAPWFATGDIGMITSEGTIQIVDRVKQLVKLSRGEYISLTYLSDVYGTADGVENIYIYADSHHSKPIALVVPAERLVKEWEGQGITDPANSAVAKERIMKALEEIADERKLTVCERIAALAIEMEPFSIENGLLTPSLKPQFHALQKKFENKMIELYSNHPELLG